MEDIGTIAEFLASKPPLTSQKISNLVGRPPNTSNISHPDVLYTPIVLHCDSEECLGSRIFRCTSKSTATTSWINTFIVYKCSNCGRSQKIFAVAYKLDSESEVSATVIKIGEFPAFGPPIPSKAISLIGPDRELFLKGRRAENQGLGIAAFAYYRRIIENQWGRFLDEIIKVGNKTGLDTATLSQIESAKQERQFDKAVKSMGDAIPPSLKLNGQNPITLLYSALSAGIHEKSDEDCLELAGHIRIILYELAERLNMALQEHNELDAAVKRLANRNNLTPKTES